MVEEHAHPNEWNDAQFEHMFKLAYDSSKPEATFVDAVSAKLDCAFSQTTKFQAQKSDQLPASTAAIQTRTIDSRSECTTPELLSRRVHASSRIRRRLVLILGTVASLFVALSLWSSPPAYGWVAMVKALEQCAWVQTITTGNGISGWASQSSGIVAAHAKNHTILRDDRQPFWADYRAEEQSLYRKPLDSKRSKGWEEKLLVLLLTEADQMGAILEDNSLNWSFVSDSWKQVKGKDGFAHLIELKVKLKSNRDDSRTVELEFLLDPQTNLPISGRLLDDGGKPSSMFDFNYPKQGPNTIFALGIPAETKWIESLTASNSAITVASEKALTRKTKDLDTDDSLTENQTAENPIKSPVEQSPNSPHDLYDWTVPAEPMATNDLVEQLNHLLINYWESQNVRPTGRAIDSEFLRRLYLDLTGRIPMVSEVYLFLEDNLPDRRLRLVDELLTGRDHATHLAAVWRSMLLPDGVDLQDLGGTAKFDAWLADRFGQNVPYDQLVTQLLSAQGRVSEPGPLLFYAALKLNPEEIAAKTARVFLGTRMECAQCHDHPFDRDISQIDFWGFAAYFAQISRPKGKMEVTSRVLRVRDNARGEVMLPDTNEVIAPRLPGTANGKNILSGRTDVSRRGQLVAWLTSRYNRRFAAATVNRVWAHLFGRGLVDPVDDMRANNSPVIPEVLELLSRDFAASGYDLRRLIRTLVLSEAYQLSSRAEVDELSQTLLFARMNIKSMTADQLYDCIAVATQNKTMLSDSLPNGALARINNTSRQSFIAQFRSPQGQRTDYQAGIPQALTFLHGQIIHGATDQSRSSFLKSLAAPFFSDQQRVETLFLATLSRLPDEEEHLLMMEHVGAVKDETLKMQAMGDVLWSLLNSAEFTFIH